MAIHVIPFNYKPIIPENSLVVNTTSRSVNWSKGLSPFFLGPVDLYNGLESKNVENGWQFSKVYADMVDEQENPTQDYWMWATGGWADSFAHRYPKGRGARPLFSFWAGEKLKYIEARKKIYIPLYANAVQKSDAYHELQLKAATASDVYLVDFDAYDHRSLGMSYDDVINCEDRKMGHAFVLAMLLEGNKNVCTNK